MTKFFASRILQAVVSLFSVTVIMFTITNVVGDPVNVIVPPGTTIELRNTVRHEMGLDRPLTTRYVEYLKGLLTGDMGESYVSGRSVSTMISERLPATLELGLAALLLTLLAGIPLGLLSGYRRGGLLDRFARLFSVLGQSAPAFWVGILLIFGISVHLGWLPTGGRGGLESLILPAFTMAWATLAGVIRLMRSSVLETLETDYITFMRVQGVSERRVLWKHASRNSILPVLTFGSVLAANIIVGSVVTESVFVWPGMGRLLLTAVDSRDYPVVQGVALVFAATYVGMALVTDLVYMYLNPRMRSQGAR